MLEPFVPAAIPAETVAQLHREALAQSELQVLNARIALERALGAHQALQAEITSQKPTAPQE